LPAIEAAVPKAISSGLSSAKLATCASRRGSVCDLVWIRALSAAKSRGASLLVSSLSSMSAPLRAVRFPYMKHIGNKNSTLE